MIYEYNYIWTLAVCFAVIIRSVNVQFAMPMPMPMPMAMPFMAPVFPPPPPPPPPPMFPMPAPMPFIFPLQIAPGGSDETAGNDKTTTTTTTTTTSKPDVGVALAMPIPMPVPMAVPALPALPAVPAMPPMPAMPAFPPPTFCQGPPPRPRNCPPCPPCTCKPSCTPSFFSYCSPCHLKCRCKRVEDAPQPIPPKELVAGPPYAMGHIIAPPPVVLVPFPPMHPPMPPPRRKPKKKKAIYSSCSEESTDSSSSDSDYLRRGKRKILNYLRRNPRSSENENELVKPMLSYISENGDIKYEAKISNDDVAELLREGDSENDNTKYQTVKVLAKDDETKKAKISSKDREKGKSGRTKYKRVFLRGGISNHVLDDGKKQLIFRPADNKKISNLSVSFQIA